MSAHVRLLISFVLFAIIIASAQFVFNLYAPANLQTNMAWLIYAVVTGTTGAIHFFLIRAAAKDPKVFVRGFMAANTIKIFIYLGFMVLYAFSVESGAGPFIGHFAAYYLIFTVFEVTLLYKYLLPKQK
jgi:hypothetical protein